jgi:diacylglycerol kinase family enzyme
MDMDMEIGCSGVLVIGGDGTVREILNALILREPNRYASLRPHTLAA